MEIDLNKITTIGAGIMRPEGVMVQKDGTVLAADARGLRDVHKIINFF